MLRRLRECADLSRHIKCEILSLPSDEKKRGLKRVTLILLTWACVVVLGVFLSNSAHADIASHGILDHIAGSFKDATGGWSSVLVGSAHTLFFYLASIELAWAGILWVMEKDNLTSFTTALIKKVMWLGFFYALLLNFDTWVPAIINSFSKAGQNAAHLSQGISPSLIVEVGLSCLDHIMSAVDKLGFWSGIFPSLMASICSLFILGCFFVIALQLLATLVESYIVLSAGIIFLGFGGSRLTSDFVQKFLGYAVSVGVKLFMIYLIVGIGMTFSDDWAKLLQGEDKDLIRSFVVISGSTFIYAGLVWKIPAFAASLMSGVSTFTAGGMVGTAAMATAGTVAVATGAVGAASAAVNSAVQGAGAAANVAGKFLGGSGGGSPSGAGNGPGGGVGPSTGGGSNANNMPAPNEPSSGGGSSNAAIPDSNGSNSQTNSSAASSGERGEGSGSSSSNSAASKSASSSTNGAASSSSPSNATSGGSGQDTAQATRGDVFMSSASGSSSSARTSVPPPNQGDGGGSIAQAPSSDKPFSKMFTPEQIQAHMSGPNQVARLPVPTLPHDEASGGTIHIKLDHPHD